MGEVAEEGEEVDEAGWVNQGAGVAPEFGVVAFSLFF